ncbi:hypothetical protein ACHAPG_009925 [Botrytis cinerea]
MKVGSYDDEKAGASNQEIKLRRGLHRELQAFDLRFTLAHYTNLCPYSPSLPRRAQLSRSRDYWHTQHSVPYPMETPATEDVKLCNTY